MLFPLIKGLTKAEKRNFRLYCSRVGSSAAGAKFMAIYDALEAMEEADDDKILKRCPSVSRSQLPNLKSHLYKQILSSLTAMTAAEDRAMQIRRMLGFATVLINKSLVSQAFKMLEKAKEQALYSDFYTLALEIVEYEKRLELQHITRATGNRVDTLTKEAARYTRIISNINQLSNLTIQLCNLNLKLGYVRTEKDKKLIISYFRRKFAAQDTSGMVFHEKLYYYQNRTWYSYIQHDFTPCYRWARRWTELFDGRDDFKVIYFDHYIRATSRLLDVMFMTRQQGPMTALIEKLEREVVEFFPQSTKAVITTEMTLLFSKINLCFLKSDFVGGLTLVDRVESFVEQWDEYIDQHYKMLLYYKTACLYFGSEDYANCIVYLQKIIQVRNPQFRRDLQVFARILNLIASYEAGDDETLESQVRSVYAFVVKINDMQAVQHAIIGFLRRIPHTYAGNFKAELYKLYDQLKPLENDPYQRRPFFYLDIISWLESKITGTPISKIRQQKYLPSR